MGRIGARCKGLSKRRICSYLRFCRGVFYDKPTNGNKRHSDEGIVQMMKKVRQSNAHNINAAKLTEVPDKIVEMRGLPRYIRCDNGPEFISAKLKEWASDRVEIKFIQPGKPTQNGIVERLNGTVRKECLNLNWFHNLDEVNELLGQWYKNYNFDRPHSSLKYKTPVAFENLNQNLYFRLAPAAGG